MKKKYTKSSYKKYHNRKSKSKGRKNLKRKEIKYNAKLSKFYEKFTSKQLRESNGTRIIKAPSDFRLIENTEECLEFFRQLRNKLNYNYYRLEYLVFITLKDIKQIDYAAISAFTSIRNDMSDRLIAINGDFPDDIYCRNYIMDSGFLSGIVDENNKKFETKGKSDLMEFEYGQKKLNREERKQISSLVKQVVQHLMPETKMNVKTLLSAILEICGNSLEHGEKVWLLGVKYETDKVIFTVTDIGKGILKTLNFKWGNAFFEKLGLAHRIDILKGAFEKKYGSSTEDINRNQGLPCVKSNYDNGIIKNLIVITNDVILHFDDYNNRSRTLSSKVPRFQGTLYQWELTQQSILNSINVRNGNN